MRERTDHQDLIVASHILANEGVLDALGHVSVRHPDNPQRYLMSRSLAPALATTSDIVEYDRDSKALNRQGLALFLERFIHGETYRARPDVMFCASQNVGPMRQQLTNCP